MLPGGGLRAATGLTCLGILLVAWAATDPVLAEVPSPVRPFDDLRQLVAARWTSDDGLPSNTLNRVLQTQDGFLWITSIDGLIRFDGREFQVFDSRSVVASTRGGQPLAMATDGFLALAEDTSGTLWIGTQGAGVLRYRGGHFEPLTREPLPGNVRAILVDGPERAWIGVTGHGAFEYHNGRLRPIEHPTVDHHTVDTIARDGTGALWFGTLGHGLLRYRPEFDGSTEAFEAFNPSVGLPNNILRALQTTDDGMVWFAFPGRLARLAPDGSLETFAETRALETLTMARGPGNELWIGANSGLLRRRVDGHMEHIDRLGDIAIRGVKDMEFDREGALWLTTSTSGLIQLSPSRFRQLTHREGIASQRVNAILESPEGRMLVGSDLGTIHAVEGDHLTTLEIGPSIEGLRVRGLMEDHRGRLWATTSRGLLQLSAEGGLPMEPRLYTEDNGLPTTRVRFPYEDRSRRFWLATRDKGLVRIDRLLEMGPEARTTILDTQEGLASSLVFAIDEDEDGLLYVGTRDGFSIVDKDLEVITYRAADGMPGTIVFDIHVDPDTDTVWLATNGGLGRFHPERTAGNRFDHLGRDHGLPTLRLSAFHRDRHGAAWMCSSIGLLRADWQDLEAVADGHRESFEITTFDQRDGMASRQCTHAMPIVEATDGRLWVPTLGGASVIDPATLTLNRVRPPVAVTALLADDVPVDLHRADSDSTEPRVDPRVEIGHYIRRLTFRFAVLSFMDPQKNQAQILLEGFDSDWQDASDELEVDYTNLPPGDYIFRVRGANDDGFWNDTGASLAVRVLPHVTETLAFRIGVLVLTLMLIVGAIRWRIRNLNQVIRHQRANQRARQRLIDELGVRNEELSQFAYTISHDLKSPLFTIQGFLSTLGMHVESGDIDRFHGDLGHIQKAADQMRLLIDDLLMLLKAGRGSRQVDRIDLGDLIRESVALIEGRIQQCGVAVEIADDLPEVLADRRHLIQIFQNLLDNAAKFMGDQPEPKITIGALGIKPDSGTDTRPEVIVFVRDNGIGIAPEHLDQVFGLFDRIDQDLEGTGLGLAIVQRLVQLEGGRIWAESEGLGHGTTFCLALPPAKFLGMEHA